MALSSPLLSFSSTIMHVLSPATLRQPSRLIFSRNKLRCTAIPDATAPTLKLKAIAKDEKAQAAVVRRTANFQPSLWDYNYVQSLRTDHEDASEKTICGLEVEKMEAEVKGLLVNNGECEPLLWKLELIDSVERLGLGYRYEEEISSALDAIYENTKSSGWPFHDLHSTSLLFRLLRKHNHCVSQDVFERFMDKTRSTFKESQREDVNGLLSLYEASFHAFRGEEILDEAMAFSSLMLKNVNNNSTIISSSSCMARKVVHALDMPLHWRPNRLEARWFIDCYAEEPRSNPTLLKLAKLDFNRVQSIHKNEVADLARWWVELGVNRLNFARDRLMEHYLWNVMVVFEPQFRQCRQMTTKVISLITMMDDVYDVFGTPEELELLTDLIHRWDVSGMDNLPTTLKTCFLAIYNTSNEIGYWAIKEHGFNVIPYIHKMWADQSKAWLKESKWQQMGHKPELQEYLNASVTSIGGLLMLLCCYIVTTGNISKEALDFIAAYPSIIWSPTAVLRLNNDLATSSDEMERGDTYKSIHCYMKEAGASEEVAREEMKTMVREMWKSMNEDVSRVDYPTWSSGAFLGACLNLARASQCFYQYGDGHGRPDQETKTHLMSVLVQPVQME